MTDEAAPEQQTLLYDSERYTVIQFPYTYGGVKTFGIEVVDKEENVEVFLFAAFRVVIDKAMARWRECTPAQEEVEAFLGDVTSSCARQPLVIH